MSTKWDHQKDWFGAGGYPVPPPEAIVRHEDGWFTPLMFHYASEGCIPSDIAAENGFDIQWIEMSSVVDDDDPLMLAYEDGCETVVGKWTPPEVDGWRLVAKYDTEDGPVAGYIRKREDGAQKP